jgi:hypothetical protein
MTDLKSYKALLQELVELDGNKTSGKWEFSHSLDGRRGAVVIDERALIYDYGPEDMMNKHEKAANAQFIAFTANHAALFAKHLQVAIVALEKLKRDPKYLPDCACHTVVDKALDAIMGER